MTELLQKQILFARHVPRLLDFAFELGFEVTIGECSRSDEQAAVNALREDGRAALSGYLEKVPRFHALALAVANNGRGSGILMSLHRERLAIDLNLFRNGSLVGDGQAYRPLAEFWKGLHEDFAAGLDFGDPPHFSVAFGGRR